MFIFRLQVPNKNITDATRLAPSAFWNLSEYNNQSQNIINYYTV